MTDLRSSILTVFPKIADFGACNLFMDWKVFDHIPLNDPVGISFADLAQAVDAEESLVGKWASFYLQRKAALQARLSTGV